VEGFERLEVVADVECLARGFSQIGMARNHLSYQQGVRVEIDA
jgi:hypothetical protein